MHEQRVIYLNGLVNEETAPPIVQQIFQYKLDDESKCIADHNYTPEPVHLLIDSGGGQIWQALSICSAMRASKAPVYTYVHGFAMSAALWICAVGAKRHAGRYAQFMYHHASQDNIGGTVNQIFERAYEVARLQQIKESILYEQTHLKPEQLEYYHERKSDWNMNSHDALHYGIIDEII